MRSKDARSAIHGPVIYCGDPHGKFTQVLEAAERTQPSAVILLGDMQAERMLDVELAPIRDLVWWIPGNHDADSESTWLHLWGSALADRNIHGRVVQLPDGTRVAGLGGVFRGAVWAPVADGTRVFDTPEQHARKTPRQDRWQGGPHLRHWGTIYPDQVERLSRLRADVLVTHEAPGYHPYGFAVLDKLARSLGVRVAVHGHQHDDLDSSARWVQQGFKSFGVGLRGVTQIDVNGNALRIVSRGAGEGFSAPERAISSGRTADPNQEFEDFGHEQQGGDDVGA